MKWICFPMLVFEYLFKFVDKTFTIANQREKLVKDAVLPFIILPVLLLIGTTSVTATFGVVIVLAAGNLYVASRPKTRSQFFYSWTLSSIGTMFLEFQIYVMSSMLVSVLEITFTMLSALCACYHFYKMKTVANEVLMMMTKNSSPSVVVATDAHYCRICRITVKDRLFHSLWWDCCVSKPNYLYFLSGQMFALVTLVYGINLSLRTLCENTQFLNNVLLPLNCKDVYEMDMLYTLPFVTSMYGLGYSLIVMMVLLRQIGIYIPKYAEMQLKKSELVMVV